MKKFLLLAALICGLSATAQEFRFGLTGGLNVSAPTHLDSKVGFNPWCARRSALEERLQPDRCFLAFKPGLEAVDQLGRP